MSKKINSPLLSTKVKVVKQTEDAYDPKKCVKTMTLQTSAMIPDDYYKPISTLCIEH